MSTLPAGRLNADDVFLTGLGWVSAQFAAEFPMIESAQMTRGLAVTRAPRPIDTAPRPWQCSRLTAHYCPLCGDCTCGPDKRGIANLSCPLHGRSSQHGERKEMVQ